MKYGKDIKKALQGNQYQRQEMHSAGGQRKRVLFPAQEKIAIDRSEALIHELQIKRLPRSAKKREMDRAFDRKMNDLTKFVFSTTLEKVEWTNSRLVKGDIAEEVGKLK